MILRSLISTLFLCAVSPGVYGQAESKTEPFSIFIFTTPRGAPDAVERMHAAVTDAKELVELSDWIELADARDDADIVVEVKAYAMLEDGTVHYIYTEADILGESKVFVGADDRRYAERKRAVSHFMEKLQDYCAEHYVRLDAKRNAT